MMYLVKCKELVSCTEHDQQGDVTSLLYKRLNLDLNLDFYTRLILAYLKKKILKILRCQKVNFRIAINIYMYMFSLVNLWLILSALFAHLL